MNTNQTLRFVAAFLFAPILSCESRGADGGESDPADDYCDAESGTVIAVRDVHNYGFESELTIRSTRVKSKSDIHFDWSGMTENMLGDRLAPDTDIGMIQVVLWNLSKAQLMDKLNDDTWTMADVVAPGLILTEYAATSADYLDLFSAGGLPLSKDELIEYVDTTLFPPTEHTYCVMMSTGVTLGKDTVMMALFEVHPDETNQEVRITSDSTDLNYDIDLTALRPIEIPANEAHFTIDWTDSLENNAMGRPFEPTSITQAILAHYPHRTATELEADFLHIEELADTLYRANIPAGTSIELSELVDRSGNPFSGVTPNGLYLFGLICGSCANPAPWFLTTLKAC